MCMKKIVYALGQTRLFFIEVVVVVLNLKWRYIKMLAKTFHKLPDIFKTTSNTKQEQNVEIKTERSDYLNIGLNNFDQLMLKCSMLQTKRIARHLV